MTEHETEHRRLGRIRIGTFVVFAAILSYVGFADPHRFVADDAGITLRYAERFAAGQGFGYNDGEVVNGCSNPLYMLAEAGLLTLGLTGYQAIAVLVALGLAGAAALLFSTFARFWSVPAGLVSTVALLTLLQPMSTLFDGLETPFVALLVALAFRALHSPSRVFHGVVLGLLVANKLDGGIAALAYSAVYVAQHRRLPWKTAVVAVATAAPMFLFLFAATGSILPNSMITKMTWHAELFELTPYWMHDVLMRLPFRWLYLGAWISIPALLFVRGDRRWPLRTVQVWMLMHLATYTWLNLGAPMLWYAMAPRMHAVILTSCLVHQLGTWAGRLAGRPAPEREAWRSLVGRATAGSVAIAVMVWVAGQEVLRSLSAPFVPHEIQLAAGLDLARQAAGVWLRKHTSGTEELACFQGLPAYEYGGPVYDTALLNSTRDEERHRAATYHLQGPSNVSAPLEWKLGNLDLVATFAYDWRSRRFELYARPGSEIHEQARHHLLLPFDLVRRQPDGRQQVKVDRPILRLGPLEALDLVASSPEAPTLLFRAHAVGAPADHPVQLVVRVGGEVLLECGLLAGAAPTQVQVLCVTDPEPGKHRITLRTRPDERAPAAVVLIEELMLRAGEPLRGADFRLSTDSTRARVDYVADVGLPFAVVPRRNTGR